MKARCVLLGILFFGVCTMAVSSSQPVSLFRDGISIHGDKFFLNDKPFFINAIGYAPWRPGQWPGLDQVNGKLIEADFQRIAKAGFNTVRTWDALSSSQLSLAQKYGLKVIQGIWLPPDRDFSDPILVKLSLDYVRKVVQYSKDYPNILMYLVVTEPTPEAVLYSGQQNIQEFFKSIKSLIQSIDHKPVSMDSWVPLAFMDHSLWDVVTVNAFKFTPEAINKTIGFDLYLQWIKKHISKDKPLFIGETGGFSVSKRRLNDIGFGGNSQKQQAQGDLESVESAIKAQAAGVCTVSWVDTWHYPSDPSTHDDHPWKWDGFLHFGDGHDVYGHPREVLNEFTKFDQTVGTFINKQNNRVEVKNITVTAHYVDDGKVKFNFWIRGLDNQSVDIGIFWPINWKEDIYKAVTDQYGRVILTVDGNGYIREQYLLAAVGWNQGDVHQGEISVVTIGSDKPFIKDKSKFFIYSDKHSPSNHFFPSGWVGDIHDIHLNDDYQRDCHSGNSCIAIEYAPRGQQRWAGVYWQNPVGNWKDVDGAYDVRRFKRLTFWARGQRGGELISQFGVGGDSPNSDDIKIQAVKLTNQWQEYTIDLTGKDLHSIIHGFRFFILKDDNPQGGIFYLDDVVLE